MDCGCRAIRPFERRWNSSIHHFQKVARTRFIVRRKPLDAAAGFARMVERTAAAAKPGFKAHPHMLRHACGYALANKGHDTRAPCRPISATAATRHRSALYSAKRQGLGRNARSLARRSARFAR